MGKNYSKYKDSKENCQFSHAPRPSRTAIRAKQEMSRKRATGVLRGKQLQALPAAIPAVLPPS